MLNGTLVFCILVLMPNMMKIMADATVAPFSLHMIYHVTGGVFHVSLIINGGVMLGQMMLSGPLGLSSFASCKSSELKKCWAAPLGSAVMEFPATRGEGPHVRHKLTGSRRLKVWRKGGVLHTLHVESINNAAA